MNNWSPLLFHDEMAAAAWNGKKTETRRVIQMGGMCPPKADAATKLRFNLEEHENLKSASKTSAGGWIFYSWDIKADPQRLAIENSYLSEPNGIMCPYGMAGDHIWGREAWRAEELESGLDGYRYRADNYFRPIDNTQEASNQWLEARGNYPAGVWRPSIFMWRWVCRLEFDLLDSHPERLHEITEEGARAEGFDSRDQFLRYWDMLNKKRGFGVAVDPWVWVLKLRARFEVPE